MMGATAPGDELRAYRSPQPAARGPFMPLLVLALAVAVWFGFQTIQFLKERDAMRATMAAQDKTVQEAKKLRDALDTIARETALLADTGNPNAKLIVEELKKRGVTINPNPTPTPAPATGK
jgi:hypothetical protein